MIILIMIMTMIASTSALRSKLYGDNEVTLAKAVLQTKPIILMVQVDDCDYDDGDHDNEVDCKDCKDGRHLQMEGEGTHLMTSRPTRAGKC